MKTVMLQSASMFLKDIRQLQSYLSDSLLRGQYSLHKQKQNTFTDILDVYKAKMGPQVWNPDGTTTHSHCKSTQPSASYPKGTRAISSETKRPERQAGQQLPSGFEMQKPRFLTSKMCTGTLKKNCTVYLTWYNVFIFIINYFHCN